MFTRGQQGKYFQLAHDAYEIDRERKLNEIQPFNEWRHKIQIEATGKFSIKEMSHTDDFDAVMLELAIIAEDDYWINRLSAAAERRVRWVIREQFLMDLEFLEQRKIGWKYIVAICDHMQIPSNINDCPAQMLIKVLQAVDTHIRRLAKKANIAIKDLPSGYFRRGIRPAQKAQAKYRHDHHHKQGAAA